MSRIGKRPIPVPANVKVEISPDNLVTVTGPKGKLQQQCAADLTIAREGDTLVVTRPDDTKEHKSLHGLTRTLVANLVTGVTTGFTRQLEINGTGYRVQKMGDSLLFQVGYSHPVQVDPPEGITFAVEGVTKCSVSGSDKYVVGQTAAQIRAIRKPDAYKGKGIKYADEVLRLKPGKSAKAGGGKKK
jgi:large subunit ribosomal protein L6